MVTMRRDVAAAKMPGFAGLSAYDRFLLKKDERRTDEKRCDFSYQNNNRNDTNSFYKKESVATKKEKIVADTTISSYEVYLIECLNNKKKDEKMMTEEEFYANKLAKKSAPNQRAEKTVKAATKKQARPSRFSKLGKIILSAYVLVTLATAFTLVAVNVFSDTSVVADAEENTAQGKTIRPMTAESLEKQEEGWFDSLCDAVKK